MQQPAQAAGAAMATLAADRCRVGRKVSAPGSTRAERPNGNRWTGFGSTAEGKLVGIANQAGFHLRHPARAGVYERAATIRAHNPDCGMNAEQLWGRPTERGGPFPMI